MELIRQVSKNSSRIMKPFKLLLLLLIAILSAEAQEYPLQWYEYMSEGYLYNIQNDKKRASETEYELKKRLADASRVSLASQIKVHVNDVSTQYTQSATSGEDLLYTNQSYTSTTKLTTNLNLKLSETLTSYNPQTEEACAITFIERSVATRYYEKECTSLISSIENAFVIANNYVQTGYKEKAKNELNSKLAHLQDIEDALFWLNIFDLASDRLNEYQTKKGKVEQHLKQAIADLQHSLTLYIECNARISGKSYPKLQNEIKGLISKEGCNFTTDKAKADYIIKIESDNDEGFISEIAGIKSYYTYVSAIITIDKRVTLQRIYEDEIKVKGGHTRGMNDAVISGYNNIKSLISKTIIENIKH